ncbi:hypothetical protein [Pseudoduganella chitinolytica]|uniref:Tetratricopeptide repeat protein n=1 Tax=Pseudoduganella chitinolytica TaxID=34070 RepID=A0ABY8B5V3_9BURK|nr:hypothetical protein [Pseudoduganella chitinolytica]WEF31265.1 hypothetical protein PX653_17580 [Pseudoduganella chitinolytica]
MLLAGAWLAAGCAAAPYRPASGDTVVTTVARSAGTPEIRQLQGRLAAAPGDLPTALALARRYIALGRAETDPRYFGHAQAVLAPWWGRVDAPPGVRLLRAQLLQNGHRFSAALADLQAVTASQPRNAEAWLTQAVVQAVQGDHAAATASCARVATLAEELAGFACLAAASVNTARLEASERLLAATLARSSGTPDELHVWAWTLLAEMAARRGAAGTAEQRYRTALALAPRDSYLLGAYADFLLDAKRPAEVLALLRERQRVDGLLLRHALALRDAGGNRGALAAAVAELQARFDAAAQRGDRVHLREEARFMLQLRGDPSAALALARQNWTVQKELADLRILLESARLAGDQRTLRDAREWVARNGTQDVMLPGLAGSGP